MSTGLEASPVVAAIENNLFFDESKLLKNQIDGDVFQSNENSQGPLTADTDGREERGENLDFTSDILDLLLCVQNDENARQNIESIMDQWDEMNLLNDDDENAKNNQPTNVNEPSEKTACEQETCTKTDDDNLFLNVAEVKTPPSGPSTNKSQSSGVDSSTSSPQTQQLDVFNQLDAGNGSQPESYQQVQQLPVSNEGFQKAFVAKSESPLSCSSAKSPQQAENAALCMKIQALTCSNCGQTYNQLMSSGVIPKIPSKPYPCPFCRGNYYKKPSAELHMKVHMEDDTLKCRLCSEASANFKRNGLGQSIDESVNSLKRPKHDAFPCLICSASLNSRVELEKHIRSHKRLSNNYRKSLEKDSAKKMNEHQKNNYREGKQSSFRSKADLDFHTLTNDTKFTKIVDKIVLHKTQSNILDHSYGKIADCPNDSSQTTKTDENQNLKSNKANGPWNRESAMDVDNLVDYDSAKLNGDNTSFNSSACDINSSYEQPNYSSSTCDVPSTPSKVESRIASSPVNNAHLFGHSSQQIFVSTPNAERNETSFINDDSINFDQNLFKTFTSVDTASSSGYDVLQRFLDEQPEESTSSSLCTSNMLLNPITNNDGGKLIFSDAKPLVVNTSVANRVETTQVVNINPVITSTKTTQSLGIKIPAANLKLGTNLLLGSNGVGGHAGSCSPQTNKSYVVMYVLPTQSASPQAVPAQISTKLLQQSMDNPAPGTARLTPSTTDSKMTYLIPIANGLHQSQTLLSPNTCNQKTNVRRKSTVSVSQQKLRPLSLLSRSSSSTSEVRLDPGKLHTAQPPPAKQIPVPNKRNILQLAYDDACKLIEDSIVQKSDQNSSASSTKSEVVSNNSTSNGNYTLLKQMLNSKPRLSQHFVSENSKEQTHLVDNSFTHGQVTFQYRNDDQDENESLTSSTPPLRSQLECEVCQTTLSNENYIAHLRTHSKTLYKCTYCQKIYVLQNNLMAHMKTHLEPQIFNCKMCSKTFSNVLLFKLHILVHKGLLFICVSCVKLFNKKEDYESHLRTHNEHDLACVQCKRKFPNPNCELNSNFICPDCAIVNENHANADSAMLLNGGNFRADQFGETVAERTTEFEDLCFPCPYCDVLASGGVEFKNHFSYHLTRPIKCFVCCEMFDKFALLANHLKTHTFPRKFFCQHCAKKFPDRESYQNHYHPNFKPYSCMVCEQGLFNQTDLTVHAMNHDMTAKCCCNFCGEMFQSSDLDEVFSHKSTHLKDSIAECEVCDLKFVLYPDLLEHISKAHDEEGKRKMAFKCCKCNVFLGNEDELSEHEQKHLKMDFVCQQCKASFMEFNELLRHWIKLHAKSTLKCFKCSCCSKFFLNEPQWLEHAEQSEKKPVLLPYSLQQLGDRSFKLEPDTKKTYCCNQCNESFRSKVDIIKHMRRLQHK